MRSTEHEATVPRKKLLLIVSLIVASTVLFVVGIVVERGQGEAAEGAGAHRESGTREANESGEAPGANQEAESRETNEAEEEEETILGINTEAPWVVTAVALGWLVLAAGLLRFGPRFLVLIALAAGAATVLDVVEVLRQVGKTNGDVAVLAAVVAQSHAAIAILSVLALRENRAYPRRAGAGSGPVDG